MKWVSEKGLCGSYLQLSRDEVFGWEGDVGPVWRVRSGLVLIEHEVGQRVLPVQIALPGDLLGAERLCGQAYACHLTAATAATVEPLAPLDDASRADLLGIAVGQQQRQALDMLRLRSGAVRDRLCALLSLVASACQTCDESALRRALPRQRRLARLIDAAHETVCRELKALLSPHAHAHNAVQRPGMTALPGMAWSGLPVPVDPSSPLGLRSGHAPEPVRPELTADCS